jgi:hypothetical protein
LPVGAGVDADPSDGDVEMALGNADDDVDGDAD